MKGCLKELKRLHKHYKKEYKQTKHPYTSGVVDGLDIAISILKNKEFYGD